MPHSMSKIGLPTVKNQRYDSWRIFGKKNKAMTLILIANQHFVNRQVFFRKETGAIALVYLLAILQKSLDRALFLYIFIHEARFD